MFLAECTTYISSGLCMFPFQFELNFCHLQLDPDECCQKDEHIFALLS